MDVISVASVFLGALGASPIGEALKHAAERRMRKAQEILSKEISDGDIDRLSDEYYEELIPSAYMFFEAAQKGEYVHNLRFIAHAIGRNIRRNTISAGKIGRLASRIQYLEDIKLRTLALLFDSFSGRGGDCATMAHGRSIVVLPRLAEKLNIDEDSCFRILSDLASRGFLTAESNISIDQTRAFYSPTDVLRELANELES
jgi:hypothetical protein